MKRTPQRDDYVKAISGSFKGSRGWVSRVNDYAACVVWKGIWDHGIWTPLKDVKVTRRPKRS